MYKRQVKAITAVKEGLQVAVAERQQPGAHPSLIALLALALQIHLALGGNDGFDIVGLTQRLHPHIIVHTQQNLFQVCLLYTSIYHKHHIFLFQQQCSPSH